MKAYFFAILLIFPTLFAEARGFRNAPESYKSMTDLGICRQEGRIARFLDGDRLKLEGFQYGASDYRNCILKADYGRELRYICNTDAWRLHTHQDGDLEVRIRFGETHHQVELVQPAGWISEAQTVFKGLCGYAQ